MKIKLKLSSVRPGLAGGATLAVVTSAINTDGSVQNLLPNEVVDMYTTVGKAVPSNLVVRDAVALQLLANASNVPNGIYLTMLAADDLSKGRPVYATVEFTVCRKGEVVNDRNGKPVVDKATNTIMTYQSDWVKTEIEAIVLSKESRDEILGAMRTAMVDSFKNPVAFAAPNTNTNAAPVATGSGIVANIVAADTTAEPVVEPATV